VRIAATAPAKQSWKLTARRTRERIHRLEKDIKTINEIAPPALWRREKTGLPIISIVGYTNAGKSTLLNTLTKKLGSG